MRVFKKIPGLSILRKRPQNQIPFALAVGHVIKAPDANTREVKVIKMVLDDYLKMYFNKSYVFETVDEKNLSKKGDIVLVRKLEKQLSQKKFFSIEKILFQIDNITDPITGKKINHDQEEIKKYLDQIIQ